MVMAPSQTDVAFVPRAWPRKNSHLPCQMAERVIWKQQLPCYTAGRAKALTRGWEVWSHRHDCGVCPTITRPMNTCSSAPATSCFSLVCILPALVRFDSLSPGGCSEANLVPFGKVVQMIHDSHWAPWGRRRERREVPGDRLQPQHRWAY